MICSEFFAGYVARPGVNFTTLKAMRRSPMHYAHVLANPVEDTTRLLLGRAGHTAVLEPERFDTDYVVFDGARRAGKEWAACVEAARGRPILKAEEAETMRAIGAAVRAHDLAAALLANGEPERTLTWTDEETGLECKARADHLGLALSDLKTCRDVDAQRFGLTAARMGYAHQLAFYRRGLRANGKDLPVKIIAVELAAPHDVAVFGVDAETLDAADEEVGDLLRQVSVCRLGKAWPGKYPTEVPLWLPTWAFGSVDDEGGDALEGLTFGEEAA